MKIAIALLTVLGICGCGHLKESEIDSQLRYVSAHKECKLVKQYADFTAWDELTRTMRPVKGFDIYDCAGSPLWINHK